MNCSYKGNKKSKKQKFSELLQKGDESENCNNLLLEKISDIFNQVQISIQNQDEESYVNLCHDLHNSLKYQDEKIFQYIIRNNFHEIILSQLFENKSINVLIGSAEALASLLSSPSPIFTQLLLQNQAFLQLMNEILPDPEIVPNLKSMLLVIFGLMISDLTKLGIKFSNVFPSVSIDCLDAIYNIYGGKCAQSLVFACQSIYKNLDYDQKHIIIFFLMDIYSRPESFYLVPSYLLNLLIDIVDNYSDHAYQILTKNKFLFNTVFQKYLTITLQAEPERVDKKNEKTLKLSMRLINKCYKKIPRIREAICMNLPVDNLVNILFNSRQEKNQILAIKLIEIKNDSILPEKWLIHYLDDKKIVIVLIHVFQEGSYRIKVASLGILKTILSHLDPTPIPLLENDFISSLCDLIGDDQPKLTKHIIEFLSIAANKVAIEMVPELMELFNEDYLHDKIEMYAQSTENDEIASLANELLTDIRSLQECLE